MLVRIFKPAKTAMQSGLAGTQQWVLEPDLLSRRSPEPLMGWVSSADTLNQVKLHFATKDEAIAYARKKGFQFTVEAEQAAAPKPKAYADNFRFDRIGQWTH